MTNKYAEGYPGKRYYGGCGSVDIAESLAIARAKELFGAEHANVQPHSGSQANQSVYFTVLNPGDTIMGLNLAHGGHLTHGHPLNLSGKLFNVVAYNVDRDTETIDFDELFALAKEHKPKLIIAGASAYPRTIPWAPFREIADEIGALFMVDMAHIAGLVAARSSSLHLFLLQTLSPRQPTRPCVALAPVWSCARKNMQKTSTAPLFPGLAGWPFDARHRRQGCGV